MKRLKAKGQSKSVSEQPATSASQPAFSCTQQEVLDSTGGTSEQNTERTNIAHVSSKKHEVYNNTSEIKADTVFAQSSIRCQLTPSIESTISEKTVVKPEKKHMPKRRKLNTSITSLFETIQNCLNEDKAPPLVLSPRSLFQQLCRVHDDIYPKLLPENTVKAICETLPSCR